MDPSYKLHVKVGSSEFNAEGPEETVKVQFDLFLKAISAIPVQQPFASAAAPVVPPLAASPPTINSEVTKAGIDRVFLLDATDKTVSLRVLPPKSDTRDADALLLILYGFQELSGEQHVGAFTLMQAARKSGLQLDRIDRAIEAQKTLYQAGGTKRGKRYSLNNVGIEFAKCLVRQMTIGVSTNG